MEQFADGVLRVVNANMEKAVRVVSVERGFDPRTFALLAFGGAGPLHGAALAEALSIGASVPLEKHLLGAAYHMLHQIGVKLSQGEPIGNPDGPWWFINLWLNLYMSKISQQRVEHMTFPNIESAENPTV